MHVISSGLVWYWLAEMHRTRSFQWQRAVSSPTFIPARNALEFTVPDADRLIGTPAGAALAATDLAAPAELTAMARAACMGLGLLRNQEAPAAGQGRTCMVWLDRPWLLLLDGRSCVLEIMPPYIPLCEVERAANVQCVRSHTRQQVEAAVKVQIT